MEYKIALMCGILCFTSTKTYSVDELAQLSSLLDHRGPDNKHISSMKIKDNSIIYFIVTQLMIVGTDPFPLSTSILDDNSDEFSSFLIGNIEIYNYKEIYNKFLQNLFLWDKEYSDAHIILPLLRKFVNESNSLFEGFKKVLSIIKGDYAIIINYKSEFLLIARDQIGVRPLYYIQSENDNFSFSSEVEPLLTIGTKNKLLRTVQPGSFTIINLNEKTKTINWHIMEDYIGNLCKFRYVYLGSSENGDRINESLIKKFLDNLRQAILERIPSAPFAIFLSGGIDSSVILALLLSLIPKDKFFVISVGFEESLDLNYSQKLCNGLNVSLNKVIIDQNMIVQALPTIVKILRQRSPNLDPVDISISLPLFFASLKAKELQCKVAMTGQGADELFIGYNRYFDSKISDDIKILPELVNNDLKNIAFQNLERDDLISMHFSIEIRFPYLDLEFVKQLLQVDIRLLYNPTSRKILLRNIAEMLSLPDFIIQRPKKAAQYGTLVMKHLYQLAKNYSSLKEYLDTF